MHCTVTVPYEGFNFRHIMSINILFEWDINVNEPKTKVTILETAGSYQKMRN